MMEGLRPVGTMEGETFRCFLPITKRDNDQRIVEGYASTEAVDSEGEVIQLAALTGALPDYMKFANLREMHQLKAVGVVKSSSIDDKGLFIQGKVVDRDAWEKVREGVLKGFSIGGRATARDPTNRKIITGLELIEISLVDRPSNPEAVIDLFRAADLKEQTMAEATPSRAPGQVWDCGIPGHHHTSKGESSTCIVEQDAKFGKGTAAVSLRQTLADAIGSLSAEQLIAAANDLAKRKAEVKTGDDDADDRTDPKDPPATKKAEPDASKKEPKSEETVGEFDANDPAQTQEWKAKKPDDEEDGDGNDSEDDGDEDDKDKEATVFADPGYLTDKKARYPLTNETQIRAAHTLLAKKVNQAGYNEPQLDQMRARVSAAWRATIGGEPGLEKGQKAVTKATGKLTKLESFGPPDARKNLKKGLMTACAAIQLLSQLDYIKDQLIREAAVEKDNSQMPARFGAIVNSMSDAVKMLLEEEVAEMLEDRDFGEMSAPFAYAEHAINLAKRFGSGEVIADTLFTMLRDHSDKPGAYNLCAIAEEFAKAEPGTFSAKKPTQTQDWGAQGAQPETDYNTGWVGKVQKMHDDCVAMGAHCGESHKAKKGGEAFKAAEPDKDLVDAIAKGTKTTHDDVAKRDDKTTKILDLLADMNERIEDVHKSVAKQRRDPSPPPRLRVVEKSDDVTTKGEDSKQTLPDPDKDPEGYRKAVFKQIQENPRIFTTGGGKV